MLVLSLLTRAVRRQLLREPALRKYPYPLFHLQPLSTSDGSSKYQVPENAVDVSYARSSGPGGQNVNKVATKVILRLALRDTAPWLPDDVSARLREQQRWRITKADELVLQCDEERTQRQNQKLAFERLQGLIDQAAFVPKEHVKRQDTDVPQNIKQRRLNDKKHRGAKKQTRSKKFDD